MNKIKNIFVFHFCMFQNVAFIFRFLFVWKEITRCCKDNIDTFKFLIVAFIFLPFILELFPGFAFEMPNEFRCGFVMLREFPQDQKVQCCVSRFDLSNRIIKCSRKDGIVS